jgi:uncharacterized membrane protein
VTERERDLERFLTFVDAIVAIAITLLVLPLVEVGAEVGEGSVADLVAAHGIDLLGFLLSFTVIARLWLAQHHIVRGLVRQNRLVVQLLLAWTLTIVFLPFPTALVVGTSDDSVAKLLYIGTMALSSGLLAVLGWAIGRDRSLRDDDARPDSLSAAATTVAFLLALVISVAFPVLGYWPLLLLVLGRPHRGPAPAHPRGSLSRTASALVPARARRSPPGPVREWIPWRACELLRCPTSRRPPPGSGGPSAPPHWAGV